MKNTIKLALIILIGFLYSCGTKSNSEQPVSDSKIVLNSKEEKKDCCKKPVASLTSEITCPECGHKKVETLPTDVCQLAYTCEKCKTVLHPKDGDCCVFCTYGDHKCPSMQ
jgi:hypothetical protein